MISRDFLMISYDLPMSNLSGETCLTSTVFVKQIEAENEKVFWGAGTNIEDFEGRFRYLEMRHMEKVGFWCFAQSFQSTKCARESVWNCLFHHGMPTRSSAQSKKHGHDMQKRSTAHAETQASSKQEKRAKEPSPATSNDGALIIKRILLVCMCVHTCLICKCNVLFAYINLVHICYFWSAWSWGAWKEGEKRTQPSNWLYLRSSRWSGRLAQLPAKYIWPGITKGPT